MLKIEEEVTKSTKEEREALIKEAKSLGIKNPHLFGEETLKARISELKEKEKINSVPSVSFSQVYDFVDRNNLDHLIECFSALDRIVEQTGNYPKFSFFFDQLFIEKGQFPTGTSVETIFSYYQYQYPGRGIKAESFSSLLNDTFLLFGKKGWMIWEGKVVIGDKPAFSLTTHLRNWKEIGNSISRSGLFKVFSILLDPLESEEDQGVYTLE